MTILLRVFFFFKGGYKDRQNHLQLSSENLKNSNNSDYKLQMAQSI